MSGQEPFLARWSRRKREVEKDATQEVAATPTPDAATSSHDVADAKQVAGKTEAPVFDPATLPPLESINALSDVTAFLRAGVPAELARAALRRVWTADPTIREFVGLAENAWDFTDPNAMPGFGPLENTEQVRRMIAEVVDQIGQAARPAVPEVTGEEAEGQENSNKSNEIIANQTDEIPQPALMSADEPKQNTADALGNQVLVHGNEEDIASQHDVAEAQEKPKQFSHRTHGGALPQ